MSEYSAKTIRAARKAKAERMGSTDPHTKVDSSDWTPPEPLNADIKTGMRPLSRRAFKAGGKVEGSCGTMRADKMPRKKSGGSIGTSMANKNMKTANEEREGKKHIGGLKAGGRAKHAEGGEVEDKKPANVPVPPRRSDYFPNEGKKPEASDLYSKAQLKRLEQGRKHGGRTKKMDGGPMMMAAPDQRGNMVSPTRLKFTGAQGTPYKKGGAAHSDEKADKALIKKMVKPEARTGRKDGGRTKGKTNINIVIGQPKMTDQGGPQGLPAMPGAPNMGGMPGARPPIAPIPAGGPPPGGAPGMAPPPPGMPPMPRKAGGRITKVASSYKDMQAGAASGEGRLQKTDIAKKTMKTTFEKGDKDFTGKGYPNKVPGATGGRTARKAGGGVHRSFKDMDAGAGSGVGRLEKAEIERSQRGR